MSLVCPYFFIPVKENGMKMRVEQTNSYQKFKALHIRADATKKLEKMFTTVTQSPERRVEYEKSNN